jgi:hypothetical protein
MRFGGSQGRDSAEFTQALQQIHRTFITTNFKDGAGRFLKKASTSSRGS